MNETLPTPAETIVSNREDSYKHVLNDLKAMLKRWNGKDPIIFVTKYYDKNAIQHCKGLLKKSGWDVKNRTKNDVSSWEIIASKKVSK